MYNIYTRSIQASTWLGNDLVCSQRNNDSMAWVVHLHAKMSVGSMPKAINPFNGDHTWSGRGVRCAMKSHDNTGRKQSLVAKAGGDEPTGW